MLFGPLIDIASSETEINHIYGIFFEDVGLRVSELIVIDAVVEEEVVQLQVVEDVASLMNSLKHIDELDAK